MFKLKVEIPIADCAITGLKKKAVLDNVHINADNEVTLSVKEIWLGITGEEVKMVTSEGIKQNIQLTEVADADGDYPESAKFKMAIEAATAELVSFLVTQKQLI